MTTMPDAMRLNEHDTVAVALSDLRAGEAVQGCCQRKLA